MKTYKYLLGLGVAAMSLSSCSNDAIDAPDTPQVADKDMTRYIALSISNNSPQSRANGEPDEFLNGEGEESRIKSCYLVFYDSNKNPIGEIVNVGTDFTDINNPNITVENNAGKGKVVEISIPKGQVAPSYVMCYLNPQSTNLLVQPLASLETTTRSGYTNGQTGDNMAFSMSNAVYYDGTSSTSYAVRPAVVNPAYVFETQDDAQKALEAGESLIEVYVERYAARISLTQGINDLTIEAKTLEYPVFDGTTTINNTVSMTFKPIAWEVNSTNKETFVSKIFRNNDNLGVVGGNPEPYTVIDGALNPTGANRGWNWNKADYHRCYWACSPAYYTNMFPEVASDVNTGNYPLEYFTFAQLEAKDWPAKRYKFESTMGTACFNSNNPKASIPSLVIAGQYTFDGQPATFFTYKANGENDPYILADTKADGTPSIANVPTIKEYFVRQASTLFYKASATAEPIVVNASNFDQVKNALTVARPNNNVLGILGGVGSVEGALPAKLASRKVTLQISDLSALPEGASLYIASGNGLVPVVANNATAGQYSIDMANSILANDVRYADQYTDGKAYFSEPIVHLGFYAGSNDNMESGVLKKEIDWNKVRIGDFGLVRNHAYTLNVTKIAGLGVAVRDINDPIVPPADTQQYYMAMRVNILQWAVVPTQNIEF